MRLQWSHLCRKQLPVLLQWNILGGCQRYNRYHQLFGRLQRIFVHRRHWRFLFHNIQYRNMGWQQTPILIQSNCYRNNQLSPIYYLSQRIPLLFICRGGYQHQTSNSNQSLEWFNQFSILPKYQYDLHIHLWCGI